MSSVEMEAQSFLERSLKLGYQEFSKLLEAASDAVKERYYEIKKNSFFVPENRLEGEKEHLSPSGNYRLVVAKYSTGEGTWNYSQGSVYRVETGALIATVRRNYGHFPYLFIEGHPKGDFLVCGESYMSQTVVDLATGERRNAPKESAGFCWAEPRYLEEAQVVVVEGCYWAASYEFKVYDFSDPFNWFEIKVPDYIPVDPQWPTIEEGGLLKTYQTVRNDDDAEEEFKVGELASYRLLRREGNGYVLHDEWVSPEEAAFRAEQLEAQQRHAEELKKYKATDPLYLEHLELMKDPALNPDATVGFGYTYEGWCPDLKLNENRVCRRIIRTETWSVELEWGKVTGPVKLEIFKNGKAHETKFFMAHSVESMRQAVAYAKEVARG